MQPFVMAHQLDVTGTINPPVPGKPSTMKVGISPGDTGHTNGNGEVIFDLPKGRTITVTELHVDLDKYIKK